jgi:NADH-quinone oxidoreductase subunit L
MRDLIPLLPVLPLAGFVVLALVGRRLPDRAAAWVGAGAAGACAALSVVLAGAFLASAPPDGAWTQVLWRWITTGNVAPTLALRLDSLSLLMSVVVAVVGFLILLYSVDFMSGEEGYARFFCYMDLFLGSMLILVLADGLPLLFVGWEGVGLCSYLLIGFWYRDPENGRAARKAFLVTRVGDAAFLLGLAILWTHLGTLRIADLMARAGEQWAAGGLLPTAAAALLLAGALGKSAQLPLQTWLPDAMAGPTPVSALIHAATMVTAGVYLLARMHALFALAPSVQLAVAIIGALTLLCGGTSALAQSDIKRVLAYSTISQIGYMFLALGVGAYTAAMFHFLTHALFKSLLFLAAGVVVIGLGHERDMHKMGGLRRRFPAAFWCFLAGAGSLAALPLVTAGFYSKDMILYAAWQSPRGGAVLWAAGVAGALLTALYAFRMVFLTFFGEAHSEPQRRPGRLMVATICVLAVLALTAGFVQTPRTLGGVELFGRFLSSSLPPGQEAGPLPTQVLLQVAASLAVLGGVALAGYLWLVRRAAADGWLRSPVGSLLRSGWGFDLVYDLVLVRPFLWAVRTVREDVFDLPARALAWASLRAGGLLRRNVVDWPLAALGADGGAPGRAGRVRWYAAGIVLGAAVLIAVEALL